MAIEMKEICHFLALEDNPNEAFFLERAFGKTHATVFVTSNTAEARDYLAGVGKFEDRIKHPMPSAVITDLHMPLEGGLEFVAWVRGQRELAKLKVYVLSGSSNPKEIEEAKKSGADRVLMKPDKLPELQMLVEELTRELGECAVTAR
jgi:CheY-like chemotaxis protein